MSGKAYPRPTYLPPLSIFNPIFFPQVFPSGSTGGGGGGGQTNDFPSGILTGNTITCYSTTGTDRNIYGISLLEFSDSTTNDYTDITTTMELTGSTLTIENTNPSSIINFVADSVQVNGTAIATGGNVSNNQDNTFLSPYTQNFQGPIFVDNTQSNIGVYFGTALNTGIGYEVFNNTLPTIGDGNCAFGSGCLKDLSTGNDNCAIGNGTLLTLTTGVSNTAIGTNALQNLILDNDNTAVGISAGYNLNGNGTNSNYNTFLGSNAGINQTGGNNNIAIGYYTGVSGAINNTIIIGNQIQTTTTGDMILGFTDYAGGTNPYIFKITPNTTSNQGIILQGEYNAGSNISIAGNITTIQNVSNSGLAGQLQIQSGSNGGGSLQLQDNGTNPPTNTGYGNFASVSGLPFYYSPTTSTWSQLGTTTTNILGTYTSSGYSNSSWGFTTIPNTLGNQFSFIIYSNTAKTTTNTPLNAGDTITSNLVSNYILAVGTAILIPYKISDEVPPNPTIYDTTGYLFTAPTSVGGLSFTSVAISQSSLGTQYSINATSTTENPITNGSTLTLVAYNSYF